MLVVRGGACHVRWRRLAAGVMQLPRQDFKTIPSRYCRDTPAAGEDSTLAATRIWGHKEEFNRTGRENPDFQLRAGCALPSRGTPPVTPFPAGSAHRCAAVQPFANPSPPTPQLTAFPGPTAFVRALPFPARRRRLAPAHQRRSTASTATSLHGGSAPANSGAFCRVSGHLLKLAEIGWINRQELEAAILWRRWHETIGRQATQEWNGAVRRSCPRLVPCRNIL
jgi:hypothetical protein